MYIKIENCQNKTERIIDYPGSIRLFLAAHSFGIHNTIIIKTGVYATIDRFTGEIVNIISKPGKREIAKYLKEARSHEINEKTN